MRIVRHWYKVTKSRSSARAGRNNASTPEMPGLSVSMISLDARRGKPRSRRNKRERGDERRFK